MTIKKIAKLLANKKVRKIAWILISVVAVKDIEDSFNKYFSTRKIKKSVR